jgi:hypothetical protein
MSKTQSRNLVLATGALMLICASSPLPAFDDDREQINKQMDRHERAVGACLAGFREGDLVRQQNAQAEIAATEAYLSVLNFPANDWRLAGHLFDETMAESASNITEFSSSLFHYRLQLNSRFEIDYSELLGSESFRDARAR